MKSTDMHARLYHMINLVSYLGTYHSVHYYSQALHMTGAEAGAQLFIHALLPYLLPYIILTQWLLKMPNSHTESTNSGSVF